ncbi:MAG TPA: class II aldolase/adducin family protein [Burkholderiaceae bacterium]|nr:class II aldolase/adducin family protein [Burkholderiaceae bacterium]
MNAPQSSIRSQVSEQEWQLRVDLAACYRLIALHGWDDLVFTHISARIPGPEHHFLINPYGLMFEEITASSLVKVDMDCKPVLPTPYAVNPAGFVIHSAIHAVREDAGCVLHTHTRAGVAVSAMKRGLMPISQQATIIMRSLAYHDYEGIAVRDDEKARLQANLGENRFMMLRNHGLLTVGRTVGEAFQFMYTFESACQVQVGALAAGPDGVIEIGESVLDTVKHAVGVQRQVLSTEQVYGALKRKLDRRNPGYDQ